MRIVLAPDAFKGSLSQTEVADALQEGICRRYRGALQFDRCLMADGGEGTAELLAGTGAEVREIEVVDAYGRARPACYWKRGRVAITEAAQSSPFCPPESRLGSALRTTSWGTGQLLQACLSDPEVDEVWLGLGGSGCSDGGIGFLAALGAEFRGTNRERLDDDVKNWLQITTAQVPKLAKKVIGLVDVMAPLTGPRGAMYQFGPQKGLTREECVWGDHALSHWASKIAPTSKKVRGAGAAGGIGFALHLMGGELVSGAQFVARHIGLKAGIEEADLVLTGEGRLDTQSLEGKVVPTVLCMARGASTPTVVVAAEVPDDLTEFYRLGMTFALPITRAPMAVETAMRSARSLVTSSGETLGQILNFWNANV